jgi:integrase
MRLLKKHFGTTPVSRFGPKALKRVVAEMVAAGWSHGYCVDMLSRTKQIFKYCASEELISHTVYDRLRTVDAKSIEGAPARPRVKQIDDVLVEATVPYCDGIVGSMIQFQRLTAVRPSEVCIMRPCDIDRSAEIWIYTPSHHKTEHLGKSRIVAIGPRSQVVLMALGPRVPAMNYFVNRRGKAFNTDTYRRAIHRACDKADIERWSPNRLRHTAATEIRAVFGLEATQATLGHEHMDTSQIYAEVNLKKMIEVAKTLG